MKKPVNILRVIDERIALLLREGHVEEARTTVLGRGIIAEAMRRVDARNVP